MPDGLFAIFGTPKNISTKEVFTTVTMIPTPLGYN
jgi:hypothetical protein